MPSMAGLQALVLGLLTLQCIIGAVQSRELCYDKAKKMPVDDYFAKKLSQRPLPLPSEMEPPLVYSWDGRKADKSMFYDNDVYWKFEKCPDRATVRYQVIDGVIYCDEVKRNQNNDGAFYRPVFEEMLLIATWLYDLPNMDLLVATKDIAEKCDDFPILTHNVRPDRHSYAIIIPENWKHFAWPTSWLKTYTQCLDERYPWTERAPRVFWRGSPSGGTMGWESHIEPGKGLTSFFANKRTQAVFISLMHPEFDVRFSKLETSLLSTYGVPEKFVPAFENSLGKIGRVEPEDFNANAALASFDGFATAYSRWPFLMLFNTPVFSCQSDLKDFCSTIFQNHTEFELFNADLSNYIRRGREVLDEWYEDQTRLKAQVKRKVDKAVKYFEFFSLMDRFVATLLHSQQWLDWEPTRHANFTLMPLKLKYAMDVVKDEIKKDGHKNAVWE